MLITERHLHAFKEDEDRQIEKSLIEEISVFAPELAATVDAAALKRIARECVENAERYGLRELPSLELYLGTMLTFGHSFDSDPLYRWARLIIDLTDRGDEKYRCDKLAAEINLYLDRINGPGNRHLLESLIRADRSTDDNPRDTFSALFEIYPEKAEFVGPEAIREMAARAYEVTLQHRLEPNHGAWLVARLMFFLGTGVTTDPMYPWVHNTLARMEIPDAERMRGLQRKARTFLQAARSNLAAGED